MKMLHSDYNYEQRERVHQKMRENHELLEAVKHLNDFCDKDPRQPYFDIKKHRHGKVYLTIRTQKPEMVARTKANGEKSRYIFVSNPPRKSKKFFGLTRASVMIEAARYVKSGQF